ncbi:MAG: hypothetical protein COT84_06280 [Chlamydiae bacterium CG10_big_fil_rev_8_21_14_0_10_35_9]|nr:MAG: hypothetical protein COT84_06280 [Chlamydiae bacterium CG10_big_fil_rev_8_21_14_0_10_35_9]
MLNPVQLEESFKEYSENLSKWIHDGIINIDLGMLHETGLLEKMDQDIEDPDDLTQYFHVIESIEKVTLFNEQFAIWIVPKMDQENPTTYVLIALVNKEKTNLELVFQTCGVYNTPKYVLKVLQHFLIDMLDTEATVTAIEKNQ